VVNILDTFIGLHHELRHKLVQKTHLKLVSLYSYTSCSPNVLGTALCSPLLISSTSPPDCLGNERYCSGSNTLHCTAHGNVRVSAG